MIAQLDNSKMGTTEKAIGLGIVPKRKKYRDVKKAAAALKAKFNLSVNQELYKEMADKDNGHNDIWD